MLLSQDQYRRGLLKWEIDSPAVVLTSTTSLPDARSRTWAAPASKPEGSLVSSPSRQFGRIRIQAQDASSLRRPWEVRWEKIFQGRIVTWVWTHLSPDLPMLLEQVPNFGSFHRLVVETPFLEVGEETTFRLGDLVVRFIVGEVVGEKVDKSQTVRYEPERIVLESGWIGTERKQGRFIEIVAPGKTADEAEEHTFCILGALAAYLSDQVVGPVLFSERHHNPRGVGGTLAFGGAGRNPWRAADEALSQIHSALDYFAGDTKRSSLAASVALACRWYEHGVRAETNVDRLLSFFVGIEAIINGFAAEHGPLPIAQQRRRRFRARRRDLLAALDGDERIFNRVFNYLIDATKAERFAFFAEQRGWTAGDIEGFRRVGQIRDGLFHGSAASVSNEEARSAKILLARMLRRELGLPEQTEWDTLPLVFPILAEGRSE